MTKRISALLFLSALMTVSAVAGMPDEDPITARLRTDFMFGQEPTIRDLQPGRAWWCRARSARRGDMIDNKEPYSFVFYVENHGRIVPLAQSFFGLPPVYDFEFRDHALIGDLFSHGSGYEGIRKYGYGDALVIEFTSPWYEPGLELMPVLFHIGFQKVTDYAICR